MCTIISGKRPNRVNLPSETEIYALEERVHALEEELGALNAFKHERKAEHGKAERYRDSSVIIESEGDVKIEKYRKGSLSLVQ